MPMVTDPLESLAALLLAKGVPVGRLRELAMPMMGEGGTTMVDSPTMVGGNSAVVPLTREARPGTGKGASIKAEDFMHALATLPQEFRSTYASNIRRMGLKLAKEGAVGMAIAGEAGPEAVQPVYFQDGGTTEDEGDPQVEMPDPGEESPYVDPEEERRRRMAMAQAGMPDLPPPGTPATGGSPQTQPTGTQAKWRLERRPDGGWDWVPDPASIPPGAGFAGGRSSADGVDIYDQWYRVKPEDLFPGVSPEWARFLQAQGPARAGEFFGNYDTPFHRGERNEPPRPAEQATGAAGDRLPAAGSVAQSTGGQGIPGSVAGVPATGGGQPSTTRAGDEDTVVIDGKRYLVSDLRGLQGDLQGGYRPFQQQDEERRGKIAAGTLTSTRTDQQTLNRMPLPTPGQTFMSQADGTVYRWDRDADGKWTLYRQAGSDERQRMWEGGGRRGAMDNQAYGWVQVRATNDINEVRQMQSLVTQGHNQAVVRNDAFYGTEQDQMGLRQRYELDQGFRQAADAALGQYDSPDALAERVRVKATKDPEFARQLAQQLIETGGLGAPSKDALMQEQAKLGTIKLTAEVMQRDSTGRAVFMNGVTFTPTGEGRGVVMLPGARSYEYVEGRPYLVLMKDGEPVQLPWDPSEDVTQQPQANSYQVEPVQQQETQAPATGGSSSAGAARPSTAGGVPGAISGPMGAVMVPVAAKGGVTIYRGPDGRLYVYQGNRWQEWGAPQPRPGQQGGPY